MNRMMTALALSGMLVAAPAFARVHHSSGKTVSVAKSVSGDKAASGEKAGETKTETGSDAAAKPAKKTKKSKKAEKTEKTEGAAPAGEAPTK
jgi:hypothetical protein